jgi:hypothetical protein
VARFLFAPALNLIEPLRSLHFTHEYLCLPPDISEKKLRHPQQKA